MTTRRVSRRRSSRGSTRRKTGWYREATEELTIAVGNEAVFDITANMNLEMRNGGTLVRSLLQYTINPTGSGLAVVDMGIVLVTNDAAAALAVPDADQRDNPGWLFYKSHALETNTQNFEEDIRAKRKFPSKGHTFVWVVNVPTTSAIGATLSLAAQLLVLLA